MTYVRTTPCILQIIFRCSSEPHRAETYYLRRRREAIVKSDALRRLLSIPDSEDIHPEDVPIVALAGSGGG